ncbi:hypothetical protein M9H77_33608 [Catharanthus roseus]|uniref:Uncharacterized protein n=1 Tax=Catharanthus roseus TaxID=4058 RepID=A0ACB9ZKM0_CATRO|nr:hypothetical protein M9H77_33608 [Catharanthus roseus]
MEYKWILESGCSNYMTGKKIFLSDIKPSHPYTVTLPNGSKTTGVELGSVFLDPTLKIDNDTFETPQEHTLELETNEESVNPTSVPEPELGNSDDNEDHPKAQAQVLKDYQLQRDKFLIPLLLPVLCKFFCCCRRSSPFLVD